LSKENYEYQSIEDEINRKEKMVPLKYVCEETAQQIEEDIEKEIELSDKIQSMPDPFRFAGYNPDVIDFIRRCETKEQAIEILTFLQTKGDISSEDSNKLLKQLEAEGLRSFGSKKEQGFYFNPDVED